LLLSAARSCASVLSNRGMPWVDHIIDLTGCDGYVSVGEILLRLWGVIMNSRRASTAIERPFIGLRPFEYSDREYFFGRDEELNALELQVKRNRFVAVVGRSGSGKSSLIRAGLRPRFEELANHQWCQIDLHPGHAPVRALALGLAHLAGETSDLSGALTERFERILAKSCFGIGEALTLIPALRKSDGTRLVLFIDQFEEMFRFASLRPEDNLDPATAAERRDEATKFVRLLLTAIKSPRLKIHIIVSIRSEFVGDCGRFNGLSEAVGRSQFLVPDMTRDQREDVIRKPVQLAGGQIDPGFVQRALNDTNYDPDQLPSLQRIMRRSWERALHRGNQDVDRRPHLTVDDYTMSIPS
jgi:hypothetical protein